MDNLFTVEVHHGGHFVCNPTRYVDGLVNHVDDCDTDRWSKLEAEDIVQRLGYRKWKLLWFRVPNMSIDEGLRLIHNDKDAMEMTVVVKGHEQVEMYVEHVIEELEDNDLLPPLPPPPVDIPMTENEPHQTDEMFDVNIAEENAEGVYYNTDSEDSVVHVDDPLSDDSDYDDLRFDKQGENNNNEEKADELFGDGSEKEDNADEERENAEEEHSQHLKSDCESEELISGGGSSDSDEEGQHEKLPNYPCFKPVNRPEDIRFQKGMLFSSLQQFKMAVTEYAVHGGYAIKLVKNDKERVRAVCEKPCPWKILCAKLDSQLTYQLKTVVLEHKCTRTYKNPRLSSKFLATKLVNKVRDHPNIKLSKIQEKVHGKYVVHISKSKAYRAKRAALDQVEGSHKEQYALLWDYCHELRRSNPGSTVKLSVKGYNEVDVRADQQDKGIKPIFHRLYICFEACKKGFQYCRPVIGVDGCHLKGPHGGILLAAVGRDPNEEYFPIAFAVVEAENKDSWHWFISLLLGDVGNQRNYTWTSDQQKGLDTTLKELQPACEHRLCCRHLYNNLRKKHPGKLIHEKFWFAAHASYTENFNRVMKELQIIDAEAAKWVEGVPPNLWSKHAFTGNAKTETLLNNLCEGFNSTIVQAREKSIISMCEDIRLYLMGRFQKNRTLIQKVDGILCPVIQKRVKKEHINSRNWSATWAGELIFEVRYGFTKFTVDLGKKECSCRRWELTGIPCCHAISCICYNKEDVEGYVCDWYKVETYKNCYAPLIYPTNGPNMWSSTGYPPIQPPPQRRPAGRPKKLRRREVDEPNKGTKLRRRGTTVVCQRCKRTGHNKRTCKGVVGGNKELDRANGSGSASQSTPSPAPTIPRTSQPVKRGVAAKKVVAKKVPEKKGAAKKGSTAPTSGSQSTPIPTPIPTSSTGKRKKMTTKGPMKWKSTSPGSKKMKSRTSNCTLKEFNLLHFP